MKVVVVGRGHVGGGLARLWSSRGHQVTAIGRGGGDATDARLYGTVDTTFVLGNKYPLFKKSSEIVNPSPSKAIVFVDESIETIDDGYFAVQVNPTWQNSPTVRHAKGAVFSFADGHAELWKWRFLSKEQGLDASVKSGGVDTTPDLLRLQDAVAIK